MFPKFGRFPSDEQRTLFLLAQLSELDAFAFYFALFGDNILATQVANQYPTKQLIDAGPTSTPNLSMDDIRGLLPSNTNWSTLRARTTKELVKTLTKTSIDLKTWYDDTVDKAILAIDELEEEDEEEDEEDDEEEED